MIDKINHYSLNNPASAYDEEALTALELAARTAEVVNKCVDKVNNIPNDIANETLKHIEEGTFDNQIDEHTKEIRTEIQNTEKEIRTEIQTSENEFENQVNQVNTRLNNLLNSNLTEGSTTLDAEIIDARTDTRGGVYPNLGESIRGQVGLLAGHVCLKAFNILLNVNQTAKTITLTKERSGVNSIWWSDYASKVIDKSVNLNLSISIENFERSTYAVVYSIHTDTIRTVDIAKREPYKSGDIVLCIAYMDSSLVYNWIYAPEYVLLNGDRATYDEGYCATANGCYNCRIDIDTVNQTITHSSGYIFSDNGNFINGTSAENQICSFAEYVAKEPSMTFRLVYDDLNNLKLTKLRSSHHSDRLICNIWFSSGKFRQVMGHPDIVNSIYVDGVKYVLSESNNSINKSVCKIFKKVCCVGDSYTSGYIVDGNGTPQRINEEFAWPHYMATATGNEYVNCGASGTTVLTWQTHARGLAKAQASGKPQAFIVGLMINDVGTGVPLGTIGDAGTNAQTYYGGMSQIIEKLNDINPKAKIFICTRPNAGASYDPYNNAVRELCQMYKTSCNTHCLDLAVYSSYYQQTSLTNDYLSGHYTAIGYEQFAEAMMLILSQYLTDNVKDFQDVAFIPYE